MRPGEERLGWPELERYSDNPLFNTKAVVQQTGIPAPTLRAWERRYKILSPERANNDYRLYSERDIAMIRWLKERVDSGMSISQAVAMLRHLDEEHRQAHLLQENIQGTMPSFQVTLPSSGTNPQELVEGSETQSEGINRQIEVEDASAPSAANISNVADEGTLDNYPATHSMRIVRERLLEAFSALDEELASKLMASTLAIYPLEEVCSRLIIPVLWRIGQLWEQGLITVSVEHFASGFLRGLLTNLLHVTPSPGTGPLAITCCAPYEAHEVAPLILALFLRRAGVRVIYLGQSIEIEGLLHTIRQLRPTLLCVSVTVPALLATMRDLGRQIEEMSPPRPIFAFGGQVFVEHPQLVGQVPGIYVDGDLHSIITQLRKLAFEGRD